MEYLALVYGDPASWEAMSESEVARRQQHGQPGAWIVTTARNRAIDRIRCDTVLADKTALLARLE